MQAKKEPEDMPSNPFTLTMLGTDTVYTPALKTKNMPQKGSYPKGETLSIISSQIKTQTPPEIDPTNKSVYPYKADEITVINGPTTLGTEVGDRIGRGVAAILKAITQGKKPINIIAHSRGAVESLLIAHEINELQNHIQNCSTMESLVEYVEAQQKQRKKKSSTPDIVKALNEELKKTTQPEEFLKSLKTHFSSCTLNLFAIDPVPGDVSPITWYDERFYIIPGIIKNAEFIFYENERSDWGFTPIFPDLSDPEQNITYLSMPGHHGTGSS